LREFNAFLHDCRSSPRTNYAYILQGSQGSQRKFLYLRVVELEIEFIIHERFQSRVIIVCILLIALKLNLADSFFSRQVTFDGNVASVDE
jgi:hypothetical protein